MKQVYYKLSESNNREPKLIIFDLPRCINMKKLESFIKDVEIIKDGCIKNSRNGSKEWRYTKPNIWIFTSEPINPNYLSTHEWKFWTLPEDNNKE